MRALHYALALTLSLLVVTANVFGQDDAWLKSHDKGTSARYYEGLFDLPNGKLSYEVIGFFAFGEQREKLSDGKGAILHALYFVPAQPQPVADVFVQVKQISSRTNYLLRSKPGKLDRVPGSWNDLFWKTDPVIAQNKIDPNKLGVIARLNSSDPDHGNFAPVILSEHPAPMQVTHYELLLKIKQHSLTSLSYRIVGRVTRQCFYSLAQPCLSKSPPQPDPIEVGTVIRLPLTIDSGPGEYSLQLHGQYKDTDDVLEPTFVFYHQPIYSGLP